MRRHGATQPGSLSEVLVTLPTCDRSGLLNYWKDLYGNPPPPRISTGLLLRAVAYKLQERECGGLKPAVKRFLEKTARDTAVGKPIAAMSAVKSGTRLIREWRGVTYEVVIEQNGVLLNGERLHSLSEAARRITGARWSGPRFFGLVKGE